MKSLRHPLLASSLLASALFVSAALPARAQATKVAAISAAETPKAYRMDAARHIYASYPEKIYKGKLPPLVHAIVVLEMDLDANGQLKSINLIRVPTHAPDVTDAVKDLIRKASPMPAPKRLGGARFTEIWLVDKSGRFQLDALTEGQR
jgi:protein TonB